MPKIKYSPRKVVKSPYWEIHEKKDRKLLRFNFSTGRRKFHPHEFYLPYTKESEKKTQLPTSNPYTHSLWLLTGTVLGTGNRIENR